MLALYSLVLMTALFSTPAAHAGSWTYVVTGDNSGSAYTDNGVNVGAPVYSPASSGSGSSAGFPAYVVDRANNGPSGSGCSITLVVSGQVTFTWQPDPNLPSDPPPDNVLVQESATAFWSANSGDSRHHGGHTGSALNGLMDAEYNPPAMQLRDSSNGYSGPPPDQSYPSPVPALVSHFKSYPSGSGTVTVDNRTVTANAVATASSWYYGAHVSVSYSASIHPQPYNWHITKVTDNGSGMLTFYYDWLSTDGNKADLTTCYSHEYVTYPGPVGTAAFPLSYTMPAPFDGQLLNPTVLPGIWLTGNPMTDGDFVDDQKMPALSLFSPHVTGGFTGTQEYEFDDTATGEADTIIPGPDSGPLSVVRSVYSPDGILWYYKLTKSGHTVTKSI